MERPVEKLSSLVQPNVKFIGKRGQPAKSPERSDRSSEINWSLEKLSLKEFYFFFISLFKSGYIRCKCFECFLLLISKSVCSVLSGDQIIFLL